MLKLPVCFFRTVCQFKNPDDPTPHNFTPTSFNGWPTVWRWEKERLSENVRCKPPYINNIETSTRDWWNNNVGLKTWSAIAINTVLPGHGLKSLSTFFFILWSISSTWQKFIGIQIKAKESLLHVHGHPNTHPFMPTDAIHTKRYDWLCHTDWYRCCSIPFSHISLVTNSILQPNCNLSLTWSGFSNTSRVSNRMSTALIHWHTLQICPIFLLTNSSPRSMYHMLLGKHVPNNQQTIITVVSRGLLINENKIRYFFGSLHSWKQRIQMQIEKLKILKNSNTVYDVKIQPKTKD